MGEYVVVSMSRTLLLLALLLLSNAVLADANDGEFLGFKVGDRLNLREDANIQYVWASEGLPKSTRISVVSEAKPSEVDKVILWITPITHTIVEIEGRIPASSPSEARAIQLRYFELLMGRYPNWRGTSTCGDSDIQIVGGEDRGYDVHNCILYTSKIIGFDYILSVYYREYDAPHPEDFSVWLGLGPRRTEKKFDELVAHENQQYLQRYRQSKYQDAEKDGL